MKKFYLTLVLVLTAIMFSCSSDDSENLQEEVIEIPTPSGTRYVSLLNHSGQFYIHKINEDGSVTTYDTASGNQLLDVETGDKFVLTCKVGEEIFPYIEYRYTTVQGNGINHSEPIKMYSTTNTSGLAGFRLMETVEGVKFFIVN